MLVVAAVDCGTNALRLLIVRRNDDDTITELVRRMEIIRLGEGVDDTGAFQPAALERAREVLHDYADICLEHGVKRLRMVATSATRDAQNREDFFALTREELSQVVPNSCAEVITGQEEARLSFAGSVSDCPAQAGPFVVVDLGGGSTELVVGEKYQADGAVSSVTGAISLNIGCVRLTERYLHSDPPTAEEIEAARTCVQEQLDVAFDNLPMDTVRSWVGLAGTFTTIAALALDLDEYDSTRIHQTHISLDKLQEVTSDLLRRSAAQRMELGPMHPGRADVIGGGAIVVQEVAARMGDNGLTEVVISERDILDGIVHDLLYRRH